MTGVPGLGSRLAKLNRRRFLLGAGAVAGAGTVAGAGAVAGVGLSQALGGGAGSVSDVPLGSQPAGLPERQHGWNAVLARDAYGNPVAPSYRRLLFFDVIGSPTPAHARVLEAALRTLERTYHWSPAGLLFTAGWGYPYFEKVLGVPSPVPVARAMSDFEMPAIDDYHLCLHLACNDEARLATVEDALVHGTPVPGAHGSLSVGSALRWRETRTGFVGAGLPARRQDTGGIPSGNPVPESSPLFMGFKSGLTGNQASEDDVTIPHGQFAGGTVRHVSYMQLRLDSWYQPLSESQRVARMYAPQVSPEQAANFTTDAKSDPGLLGQAIGRYGVIGHAQTCGRVRRNDRAIILRRDFNTTDGGQAGLHFVCLQRTFEDFATTRTAMNASSAQLQNPSITDTVNNGINEFIFVTKRGNYLVPPRAQRSFPLLPGRHSALA